jgi:hypothetical protein
MGLISGVPAVDASGGWIETQMGDTVKVDLVDKLDTVDASGHSRCNVAERREVHYVHLHPHAIHVSLLFRFRGGLTGFEFRDQRPRRYVRS